MEAIEEPGAGRGKALNRMVIKEQDTVRGEGPGAGSHRRARHWLGKRPWNW